MSESFRLKDLKNEELRHTLAHLHSAIEANAEGRHDDASRELAGCEAAIFDYEEDSDGVRKEEKQGRTQEEEVATHIRKA